MTWVIPLEARRSIVELLRRIEELIPAAEGCRDDVASLNQLIDRRNALLLNQDSAAEYTELCKEIESRLEPFNAVDQQVRAVASDVQDLLARLPSGSKKLQQLREQIERLPLLSVVECALQVDKAAAVRDLRVISRRLQELIGQRSRPTPAEVIEHGRKELGLTIEQLAAKAGVNPKQIYSIKRGENPKANTIRLVAAALSCEPGDLIEPAAVPSADSARPS